MFGMMKNLLLTGVALGVIAGNADEIEKFFTETMDTVQQIATVGDIKSIGNMLDYEFMKRGRLPAPGVFTTWVEKNFRSVNKDSLSADHWGNQLIYKTFNRQRSYALISKGPDGLEGTKDDIEYSGP